MTLEDAFNFNQLFQFFNHLKETASGKLDTIPSTDGVLDVTLDVSISRFQNNAVAFNSMTYNGKTPGPTLFLNPGDTLKIKLVNHLTRNKATGLLNHFCQANTTNIHLHRLLVDPNMDDPFLEIEPGNFKNYEFLIHPSQSPSLYWYTFMFTEARLCSENTFWGASY